MLHISFAYVRNDSVFFQCWTNVQETVQKTILKINMNKCSSVFHYSLTKYQSVDGGNRFYNNVEDAFMIVHPSSAGQHDFRVYVQVVWRRRIKHDGQCKLASLQTTIFQKRQPLQKILLLMKKNDLK